MSWRESVKHSNRSHRLTWVILCIVEQSKVSTLSLSALSLDCAIKYERRRIAGLQLAWRGAWASCRLILLSPSSPAATGRAGAPGAVRTGPHLLLVCPWWPQHQPQPQPPPHPRDRYSKYATTIQRLALHFKPSGNHPQLILLKLSNSQTESLITTFFYSKCQLQVNYSLFVNPKVSIFCLYRLQ